ncbi:MAG: DUF5688 family protein [Lachnospiraceae bacterium]|nr:DUF5688 family protein [Lachnospiraceae bacterium]
MQGRNFFLLPSSIHETILVMDEDRKHGGRYSEMVCEVNDAVVEENEMLSDHAYFYDKESGVLEAVLGGDYMLLVVLRVVIGTLAGAFLWFLFRLWHDGKRE